MRLALPLATLALASTALFAAEPEPAFDAGLTLTLEGSAGLSGGIRRGEALHALTLGHVAWRNSPARPDAPQFRAYASVLNHEGRGPTGRFLGDFLAASNTEAHDSTRLYSWWVEGEQAGWSLRAGALLADEEFTGTDGGGQLSNSVFGWPAFISANTVNTGPAFYVAAPGLRLARTLTPTTTWRLGIYDGDTFDSALGDPKVNRDGLHLHLGGAQGWFAITELAWAPADGTRFKAGAWHHTAKFPDQQFDSAGRAFATSGAAPRDHTGNTGLYASAEHTVFGSPGKPGRVDAFARLGGSPADRNTLGWVFDGGLAWTGPLPGRPADVAALGFAHADFSSRYAATARLLDPTTPRPDYEQVLEASYTARLNDHLTLKPDLQYIRHPGGTRAQRDAVLAMLRVVADF
ncbi:MAG: carbohydrate porin [Verrucomicrobia bacterium]|nr:carbohydrate porin [Verrucomicrobiota bacterium]